MSPREQILQEALALPAEDRVFLADRLEESLSREEFASPAIAAAWNDEIERRLAAFDRGEDQATDAAQALDRMRHYLDLHRACKATS